MIYIGFRGKIEGMRTKQLEIEQIPIGDLKPNEKNPRINDAAVDAVARSIQQFGFNSPIITDGKLNIAAGHTRLKAAMKFGLKVVPVVRIRRLKGSKFTGFALADNRTAEIATWDQELLKALVVELSAEDGFDLDALGFSNQELNALLDQHEPGAEDDVPPAPEIPVTQLGDLYLLGKHRLLCGDATEWGDLNQLMDSEKAALVFTDPPFNLKFKQLAAAFTNAKLVSHAMFWMGSDKQLSALANDDTFCHYFVQDLITGTMLSNHQPITLHLLIAKFGRRKMNNLRDGFSTIVRVRTTRTERDKNINRHEKRVALPFEFIVHYSAINEIVLDLFLGSGSTLMACAQINRRCFGIELDPANCDVIVRRWENYTGNSAERIPAKEASTCAA